MNLLDIAEPALVLKPGERVSKAISKMTRLRKPEALVVREGKLLGILAARDLAKRKINNPDQVGISKFIRSINPALPDTPIREAISSILVNDYPALPLQKGSKFFVLTKLGILNAIRSDPAFKGIFVRDIMRFPYSISSSDTIATAVSVLRETGVSRLLVLNEKNGLEGLLEALDLLNSDISIRRSKLGEKAGETKKLRAATTLSLIQKNVPKASPDTPIRQVIKSMAEKKIPTTIIEKGGRVAGIVTPKLILKLLGKPVQGIYVRVSGLQREDTFIKQVVDEEIRHEIQKLARFFPIDHMVMHVDRYHQTGRRVKYSVRASLITERGMFFAREHDWDITKAVRGILQKLEREIIKKKEKAEVYRRGA